MSNEYISKELYRISPLPVLSGDNGQFKVKFYSDKGQTKVMNITNEQFRTIEQILNGVPLSECFDCNNYQE